MHAVVLERSSIRYLGLQMETPFAVVSSPFLTCIVSHTSQINWSLDNTTPMHKCSSGVPCLGDLNSVVPPDLAMCNVPEHLQMPAINMLSSTHS